MGTTRSKPAPMQLPPLCRNELHCVFAFLEWRELGNCACVCRDWQIAAASVPPSTSLTVGSQEQAEQLLRSPLRSHVAALKDVALTGMLFNGDGWLWPLLDRVAVRLERLRHLQLQLPFSQLPYLPLRFPSRLQSLVLRIFVYNAVLAAAESAPLARFAERLAGAVPPTLCSLTLYAGDNHSLPLPLAGLAALARVDSLTALHVTMDWDEPGVRALCRGLRQLRSLLRARENWSVYWTAPELSQLTEGGFGVDYSPLESLGRVLWLGVETLSPLLRLPSLTQLDVSNMSLPHARPLLAGLPLLKTLCLRQIDDSVDGGVWWRNFAVALQQCSQLTALTLHNPRPGLALTDKHLAAIVCAVPLLQSLSVDGARLTSLCCFAATPHLEHTLHKLRLLGLYGRILWTELEHLRSLRALRELHVSQLSGWTFSSIRERLTPGHAKFDRSRWPHLTSVMLLPVPADPP